MKILLTGGAGFIGSHVADLCISENHQVVIVDDLSRGKAENIPAGSSFYQMNITDPGIRQIFKKERPEVIVHHAAQVSVGASVMDPLRDMDSNIRGTVLLLQASVEYGIKKFIFASTGGAIYGEHDYFPADECHPLRPLSPYGVSKLAAERYIYCYNRSFGLNYTVLRYSNVYGPRQDPHGEAGVVAIFIHKMLTNQHPIINGTGDQTRDFVFVGDVARANLLSIYSETNTEINICTGEETSVNQLFLILKSLMNSTCSKMHGPAVPGEQLRSVLAWKKANDLLGWQPQTPRQRGFDETVKYFKYQLSSSKIS